MLSQLSLGFEFREAKEFSTHLTAMFFRIEPAGLGKTRDGQYVTAMIARPSRIQFHQNLDF